MHSAWTSLEMQSGRKPLASITFAVALPHAREDIFESRRRMIDMNHHRQTELLRRLPGDVEGDHAGVLRRVQPDAHFDSNDRIEVRARDFDRVGRRHQPEVAALADHHARRETEDAGERYIEKGEYPNRTGPDHVAEEPGVVAGSCAPCIDKRRASSSPQAKGIDAK